MSKIWLCDGCGCELNEYIGSDEDWEDVKIAEEIVESIGYGYIDLCPECSRWLNEKVRELVDNKFQWTKGEE